MSETVQEQVDRGCHQQTYLGGQFFIEDPRADEVDIRDIAHPLSMACRWRGACLRFYSVAEHCVILATYTQSVLQRPLDDVLMALLHDAHEAYTGDITTPTKNRFPEIRAFERKIQDVIQGKYGLPEGKPEWLDEIDQRIRWDERAMLLVPRKDHTTNGMHEGGPLGVGIQAWEMARAEGMFLSIFSTLIAAREAQAKAKANFDPNCEVCGPKGERSHPGKCRVVSRIVRVK